MIPVVTTFETAVPEMVPKSAEATTEIFAAPPRLLPTVAMASSVKNCPPPAWNRSWAHQDEHDDDRRADLERNAKQGVGVEAHIDGELPELDPGADQLSGHQMAERRIEDEDPGDAQHHIAGRTPQPVEDQDHHDRAEPDGEIGAFAQAELAQEQEIRGNVEEHAHRYDGECDVVPGNASRHGPVYP